MRCVVGLLVFSGCVPHKAELTRALEGARDLAAESAPCLVAVKQAQVQACASDTKCLEEVRAHWSRMADALDSLHVAWCLISPESEGCL